MKNHAFALVRCFLLFCLSICFFSSAHSQKVQKYYNYKWQELEGPGNANYYCLIEPKDSIWSEKDYFFRERVLQMQGSYKDKDCKIPHGIFSYYYNTGTLKSRGAYVNGKKDGLWLSFHENRMMSDSVTYHNGNLVGTNLKWYSNGMIADSSVYRPDGSGVEIEWFDTGVPAAAGLFSAGYKRTGKWKYFHSNGQLSAVEIYENDLLVNKEYFDENGVKMSDTTNHDRPATFPGGEKAWRKFLGNHGHFPTNYTIVGGTEGVVMIGMTIDENGKLSDIHVESSFHPDFDKLALDAVNQSPDWLPAISHNRKIKVHEDQPFAFEK